MHGAVRAENFVPTKANIEFDKTCEPMWALSCPFANFWAKTNAGLFANMSYRKFTVLYEEQG